MSKQFRTKSILPLAMILLATVAGTALLNGQFVIAQEDHTITTVMVLQTTGGTTSLGPGNHSYANATVLTMVATANSGYDFLYWNITGIMNTAEEHEMGSDLSNMTHGGPFGNLSDLDSLILTDSSVTITIDCGYTYQYQAVFAPSQNSSPTGTFSTSVQQQTLGADNTLTYLAIGLIGGIAAVAAVAGLYLKRKKQNNAVQSSLP